MPSGWYRARTLGKTWYPSLKTLVGERQTEREDAEADDTAEETEEAEA